MRAPGPLRALLGRALTAGQFRRCGAVAASGWPGHREHQVKSVHLSQAGPSSPGGRGVPTHRWAGQAGESSLTTLPRQTDDAPLTGQTLGTWRTVGTLREERREVRT